MLKGIEVSSSTVGFNDGGEAAAAARDVYESTERVGVNGSDAEHEDDSEAAIAARERHIGAALTERKDGNGAELLQSVDASKTGTATEAATAVTEAATATAAATATGTAREKTTVAASTGNGRVVTNIQTLRIQTFKTDTVAMESGATEGLRLRRIVRQIVQHRKIILVAIAASFVNILPYLNGLSFSAAAHDINVNFWQKDETSTAHLWYMVAGILSNALFAFLFQRYRRKTCLYLVCICQLTSAILLLCTNSFTLLQVSRAASAIGDIGAGMFCVIYVSEIAPDDIRGGLVGIHKLLFNMTELLPLAMYFLHFPLKSLPFSCISIVITVLVVIWTNVGVPESPIYFLRKEDTVGAEESLECLYGSETNTSQVIANRMKILKATRSDSQTSTSILQECINRRTLTYSCIAMALYFMRIVAGFWLARFQVEALLWELPKVANWNDSHLLIIDMVIMLLANLVVLVLCDRVGRKMLLLVSLFASSIFIIIEGIHNHLFEVWDIYLLKKYRIFLRMNSMLYLCSLNLGISILPEVLVTDIFPPRILPIQVAMLGSLHLFVDYVFHYEIYKPVAVSLSVYALFWLFGGLLWIGILLIFKFLLETKRRPPGFMFIVTEESVLYSTLNNEEE